MNNGESHGVSNIALLDTSQQISTNAIDDQIDDLSITQEEVAQTYYDTESLTPPQDSKSLLSCFYNSKTSQKQTLGDGPDITHLPEIPDLTGRKPRQPGKLSGNLGWQ